MKISKMMAGLIFSSSVLLAMQASAYQAVACSWSVTSQSSGPTQMRIDDVCKTDAGATVATRTRYYGQNVYNPCVLSVYSPYFQTGGTCAAPTFGF